MNIQYLLGRDRLSDRANLLIDMGVMGDREVPLFINNAVGQYLNPFLVYKFFCEKGLPKEMIMDILSEQIGINAEQYWYSWCDFWLETFMKGDLKKIKQNFIINPV